MAKQTKKIKQTKKTQPNPQNSQCIICLTTFSTKPSEREWIKQLFDTQSCFALKNMETKSTMKSRDSIGLFMYGIQANACDYVEVCLCVMWH